VPGDQVSTTVGTSAAPGRFREMPGAASVTIASALGRAPAPARVLGAFPTAVYVDGGDTVVAVVTHDAVRLPNSVVVPVTSSERPFDHVNAGTPASIGNGCVTLGPLTVRATRWWDSRVRPSVIDHAAVAPRLATLGRLLAAAAEQPGIRIPAGLGEALRAHDLTAVVAHARAIVGLGPGLTPSGDDILGGVLASLRVLGRDHAFVDSVGAAVAAIAPERTTALSATLLRLAADGHVSAEAAGVLRSLSGDEALDPAVGALLRLGHTSGADMAAGILIGGTAAVDIGSAGAPIRTATG
jgi:hypothetical protein